MALKIVFLTPPDQNPGPWGTPWDPLGPPWRSSGGTPGGTPGTPWKTPPDPHFWGFGRVSQGVPGGPGTTLLVQKHVRRRIGVFNALKGFKPFLAVWRGFPLARSLFLQVPDLPDPPSLLWEGVPGVPTSPGPPSEPPFWLLPRVIFGVPRSDVMVALFGVPGGLCCSSGTGGERSEPFGRIFMLFFRFLCLRKHFLVLMRQKIVFGSIFSCSEHVFLCSEDKN